MNSVEMHIDFRVKFNKVNSNKNKAFLPQEIDLFLNDQMDRFVEIKTSPKGNYKGEGFEESQKRLDDVRTVIKEGTTDAANILGKTPLVLATFQHGKYVNLPVDYLKLISDWSDTFNSHMTTKLKPNRLFSNATIQEALNDPYHRSHVKSPVSQIFNNELRVYEDGFTVAHIHISYVYKYPRIVYNLADCVLPVHTHREIVDMAVTKVDAVLNTDNYEKYLNEISKNE
jgi:hypothetical protein